MIYVKMARVINYEKMRSLFFDFLICNALFNSWRHPLEARPFYGRCYEKVKKERMEGKIETSEKEGESVEPSGSVIKFSGGACKNCGRSDFQSRNHLFRHLKECLINRNPFNYEITPEERFFKENNAYIFVTGGRFRGKTLNFIERYNCKTDSWEFLPEMKEHRGSHGSVAIFPYLYILGGGGLHSNLISGEKIHCVTFESQPLKAMIHCRHAFSVVSYQNQFIFTLGGWANGTICCQQIEKYDIASEEWIECAPMTIGRRLFGAAVCHAKIYCFGGKREDGVWDSDSLEIYDIVTNTWSVGKPLPMPGQTSAVTINDFIYVTIHGHSLYRYDPRQDLYEKLVDTLPLLNWYCFDMTTINQELYFHGGNVNGKWSNVLWKYHPYLNTWKELTAMKKVRRRCSAAVLVVPKEVETVADEEEEDSRIEMSSEVCYMEYLKFK
jgi:hypothetical protein